MDIPSIISSLLEGLPEEVALDFQFPDISGLLPSQPELLPSVKSLGIYIAAFILIGLLGRIFMGKRSSLGHALSSAVGILFIYAVTAIVYAFHPWSLDKLLSPLPFVAFSGEYMRIFPMMGAHFTVICYEVLGMLILAFLMNLFDTLLPEGDGPIGWFLLRMLSVLLTMIGHLAVRWLFGTYLPDVLALYAPMIVLGVLVVFLFLGILNFLMGLFLTSVNALLGAVYTFFFSHLVGKQITKAVLTTTALTVLVLVLGYLDIGLICISPSALLALLPGLLVLMALWYLIGWLL